MHVYKSKDYINTNEKIHLIKYAVQGEEKTHRHEFIEMEYISHGSGYQTINGIDYPVERGDFLFFNFGDVHSFYSENDLVIINCLINPEFIAEKFVNSENILDLLSLTYFKEFNAAYDSSLPIVKFFGKELIEIEDMMESMLNEYNLKRPGYITILKGYINILLVKMLRVLTKTPSEEMNPNAKKITDKILKYIEENYNKKISLKQLSKECFYNPSYFSKLFKECFGKTLSEYIIGKRMDKAMQLFQTTEDSIEQISYNTGYNDKKQFYKHFKAHTGITPNLYRQKLKS